MNKINIIFLVGTEPPDISSSYYLSYVFSLASVLEKAGYSFKILNIRHLKDYSLQGIVQELKKYHFDAIGMTTNSDNIKYVYKICDKIKLFFPNTAIILGGPQVSFADEKTLKESKCDIVIRHEGEMQLLEIIECLDNGSSYEHIKGISYRNGDTIIKNENNASIDINKLPIPQYAILSDKKYWIIPTGMNEKQFSDLLVKIKKSFTYFMTGRGCPYKCAFCVEGSVKNKYRFRDKENIKKDLTYFFQITGHTHVNFCDDTFTSSLKRVKDLCNVFIEVQKEFPFFWFCEGRVDILSKYPEMITIMYNAGLVRLQIGIESGNQKTLNLYNKGITLEQIEAVVKESVKYEGLVLAANVILGNPQESLSDMKKTLEFVKRLMILSNFKLHVSTSYLTPFYGTLIREDSERFDIEIIPDFEFCRLGMGDIVAKPKSLSKEEIDGLGVLAQKDFFKTIYDHIFKLSRNYVLSFYKKESQRPDAFYRSWEKLVSFKKYLTIWQNLFVYDSSLIVPDLCHNYSPLRLWRIEYDYNKKEYSLMELTGEIYIINEEKVFLWEQATGKKSIYKIYEEAKIKNLNITLNTALNFYKELESKWALLFIQF
jgi:radical SAM superfamily enzyme YgiQ (UPF0313 family)